MAQTMLERSEVKRVEEVVAEFDPATHPSFVPLRGKLTGDDLEAMRDYIAEEIRARLKARLLARASGGLLQPAEELPNPFDAKSDVVMARHRGDEGLWDATFGLVRAAEAEFFGEAAPTSHSLAQPSLGKPLNP